MKSPRAMMAFEDSSGSLVTDLGKSKICENILPDGSFIGNVFSSNLKLKLRLCVDGL